MASAARREHSQAVKTLEQAIQHTDKQQVTERVAYIWFNRFCALRFMDVNRYNTINIVSPADEGQFQPEILTEAKMGHIDEDMVPTNIRQQIAGLLEGHTASRDPQGEAYRLLVVAACNSWNKTMPFLFQRIDDYTELLMPDDLLSGNSMLAYTREAMTPDACQSVEVIGWLYQYYISEKKDQVIGKVVKSEDIPAATQLFTPNWIVKYLVQNSLGRQWMLTHPHSPLKQQMDYFIPVAEQPAEAQQTLDALIPKTLNPEDIKVLDPACGSGHILVEAYDLLYDIYLESGYDPTDIPALILTKNLYGIEIDERAAELAAFALTMKAMKGNPYDDSNNRRRFMRNPIKPNICKLDNLHFSEHEIQDYFEIVGQDLFTAPLKQALNDFEQAETLGSLIQPQLQNPLETKAQLEHQDLQSQLFIKDTHDKLMQFLHQAHYLTQQYDCVIANPPYMGKLSKIKVLDGFTKKEYPNSKSDLFAIFIERGLKWLPPHGLNAMVTMQSWMFLSSYEKMRKSILSNNTILSMAHLGTRAFDSIGGEVVSTTAFVIQKAYLEKYKGTYLRLVDGKSELAKAEMFKQAIKQTQT
ncbi:BREX-1 system adenine-specific DNA-methyltransferase PglX [Thiomicrospira microaerophila]|uniref:BREX-1 system adenine-specific DNA-methyltransferase PglX n=1 Tax=Thiomicrospira microaerophila TaxID=406020 RepID=UPI000695A895|nr:BREX-1 system adenine-specific DNA-methyltransferase PglX [Thiomicrospira microaerophila]